MGVTTSTRRGLVLSFYSEGPLLVGVLLFAMFPARDIFLWSGVLISLVPGGIGGLVAFAGRHEFGPAQAKAVARTMVLFPAMLACLGLAYVQMFDIVPQTLRIADLYAPLAFLTLVLLLDQFVTHQLLWQLAGDDGRRWIRRGWAWVALLTLAFVVYGAEVIDGLLERSGGMAANRIEAVSYVRDFQLTVLRGFAVALLLLRITLWPPWYKAISNVAEAESAPDALAN